MFFQDRTRAADPFSPGMEWTMAAPLPFVLNQQNHDFVRRQKWQAAVLPFGARPPARIEKGHAPSAPESPRLGMKMLVTTAISAALWLALELTVRAELFSFREMAAN